MLILAIMSIVLIVILIYPFITFPISYLKNIDSADGLYVLYAPKNDKSQRALRALKDVEHIRWIDVTRLDVMNVPVVDTKSQSDLYATSRRVILGNTASKEAGQYHHRLCSTYGFANMIPHFSMIHHGKIVDQRTGFPNDWFR